MTRLAEKAGTAGNESSSSRKMGIVASFVAAACLLSGISAWAGPEAGNTPSPESQTLKTAANNNFKNENIGTDAHWTIRLSGSIDQAMAQRTNDKLRALNQEDPTHEITMIINSTGGGVTDGMSMYDTMQSISNDIRTVCEGRAMSMAAVLLAAGTPGKRMAYGNCIIMFHQLSSENSGSANYMKAWQDDIERSNEKLVAALNFHTGLSKEELRAIMLQDIIGRSVKEMQDMGLIDTIILSKPMEAATPRKLPDDFCQTPGREQLRVCPMPARP